MLFNPVANVSGAADLRIIAGDAAVGQAFCDPLTFAGPPGSDLDARVRELLRLVWPSTPAQAHLMWGARIATQARQHPIDALIPEVIADVIGLPAPALRKIKPQEPLPQLYSLILGLVHKRSLARPETVLDELLFWRGLGQGRVSLESVASLVTALTAAVWDATTMLLPALLDASLDDPGPDRAQLVETALANGPGVIGWLRTTTQSVLLDGELIPAGERCLLLTDAEEPPGRRTREPLRTLRWLNPDAPNGAGAMVARLVGNALPTLPSEFIRIPQLEELPVRPPRRLQLILRAAISHGTPATARVQARRSRRA
ncbi:hypothetical protein [Dactylosporangium sp. NPDC051541]|uniref:hypothetical protein n=1 Tax=Dactylosporangium sp. NPDC051541 TaxID=3363977 RepID=UPI00379C54FD